MVEAIEDPGFKAQGYEQVGIAKADKGQFEKAGDIAALMAHPDGILMRVAIRQSADGDDSAAKDTIRGIEFPRDAVMAFNTIAAAAVRDQKLESAAAILSLSAAKAAEIEHDEERIRSFCEIGNLHVEASQKGTAFEVFGTASNDAEELDGAHRDPLLAQTAIGFLNAGSVDFADRTLDAVSDKTQIATVVLAFSRDHWRREEKEDAMEALEEAFEILRSQGEGETRDSRAKFNLMGTIAAQFAGFQKYERSIDAAETILDESQKVNALSRIAAISFSQNEEAFARECLAMIADKVDRVIALIGMSDAVSETGIEKAEVLLREAETALDEIELLGPKADALIAIGERYYIGGRNEKVRSTISKILRVVSEMRDDSARVSALARTAKLSKDAGLDITDDDVSEIRAMLGQDRAR